MLMLLLLLLLYLFGTSAFRGRYHSAEQPSLPWNPPMDHDGEGRVRALSQRVWLALLNMQTIKFCFVFVQKNVENSVCWIVSTIQLGARREKLSLLLIPLQLLLYVCFPKTPKGAENIEKNLMHFNFLTFMNISFFSCGWKVAVINKNTADKCHKSTTGDIGAYYQTLVLKFAIYDFN